MGQRDIAAAGGTLAKESPLDHEMMLWLKSGHMVSVVIHTYFCLICLFEKLGGRVALALSMSLSYHDCYSRFAAPGVYYDTFELGVQELSVVSST